MNALDSWLAGGPTLNLVSLLLALAGLAASLYFYVKGKREKEPVYLVDSFELIRPEVFGFDGLKVTFHDEPVKSLSLSRVAIWNRGHATILGHDLVTSDQLRIEPTGDGQVLTGMIAFAKKKTNNVRLSLEPPKLNLYVDYLDHRDGLSCTSFTLVQPR